MIDLLDRPHVSGSTKILLRRMLRAGPWCWPAKGNDRALTLARRISGMDGPTAAPGQVPLLTVNDTTGAPSLWVLLRDDHPLAHRRLGTSEFGKDAREAWDHAAAALPRSLPLLWAPLRQARSMPFVALRLASLANNRATRHSGTRLDGASFGISFVLALASLVFQRSVPDDLVASAQVTSTGAVKPVDGITAKVEVVADQTRRVRRFLVAPANLQEARIAAQGSPIEPIPVRSAAKAVEEAFGKELGDLLVNQGHEPTQRAELCESFYRLALSGRDAALDWTPVLNASTRALKSWKPNLSEDQRNQLLFTQAVAARHEGMAGADELPDEAWIDRAPADLRIRIVANFVQEASDKGTLSFAVAERLGRKHLVEGDHAFAPHLELLGALGRLFALTGQPAKALAHQEQAARGFFERHEYASISFPISECYRLAGALEDAAAFDRAEDLREKVGQLEGFDEGGLPYVRLTRARARVLLHDEGAVPDLEALGRDRNLPDHVRWSAIRWLCFHLISNRNFFEASEWLSKIEDDVEAGRGHAGTAETFLWLSRLDLALEQGNESRRDHALERLVSLQPHQTRTLRDTRPGGTNADAYVPRFFPY